jgi:arginine decarboxylase
MSWSIELSRACYNLAGWSDGYVDVNAAGHLVIRPGSSARSAEVDLVEVAETIRASGLNWPVLVRCGGILRDRVDCLCDAFETARAKLDYQGGYMAAYPIKVNQQFSVVQEILEHGQSRVGLEAGSKSELMAVLGLSQAGGLVICNGYKDREYIRLALIARKLGQRIYLVVEKISELDEILRQAAELDVSPLIGVRVRLASIGAGNWQNTGGDKSKFGLHATQVLEMIERLRDARLLDSLQLLHFHLGSQLANLRDIECGVEEAARFFSELHFLGAPIQVVDAGGGLGVDYEGTASHSLCSMNYTLLQYAELIVGTVQAICVENRLPEPEIITESGRAMTAHHAFLLTNVIDTEQVPGLETIVTPGDASPDVLTRLQQLYKQLEKHGDAAGFQQSLAVAIDELHSRYSRGLINLEQRAQGEQLYYAALRRLLPRLDPADIRQKNLKDELGQKLADKVFCNLSIFQSLPDVWAIDQVFPIVPLQRLDERPDRRARIEDLTCDSDGRIDFYVDGAGIENNMPLHAINKYESYLLGFFLVGAYQEILGDMHNLFGDTDAVNLEVHADGSYELSQPEHGDRADELLRYVHFDPHRLRAVYRQRIQSADLSESQARQFLAELEAGLSGYTYHEG